MHRPFVSELRHRCRLRPALFVIASLALAACGSVEIQPEPVIPKALIVPIPAKAGIVLAPDQRAYHHVETRAGVDWAVRLGAGHVKLANELFDAMFEDYVILESLEAARGAAGLDVILEPRMVQYSFATARETGGDYYAVTISYRIDVYAPDLSRVDSYTITGYGNAPDQAMSSSEPLAAATRRAMRDAVAKFLVQFPEQRVAQQLLRHEPLEAPATAAEDGVPDVIEAMPIVDPRQDTREAAPPEQPPVTVPPVEEEPAQAGGHSDATSSIAARG